MEPQCIVAPGAARCAPSNRRAAAPDSRNSDREPSLLPQPVKALLATAFPGHPLTALAPAQGGFSNLTVTARIGGVPVVVKAAERPEKRADLRREAHVLALLRRRLAVPRLLATVEDEGWTVLVLRQRRGLPGVRLYGGPQEALMAPLTALGRTLARLHRRALAPPPEPEATGLLVATRAARLAARLNDLPLPGELRGPLAEALTHPAWNPARPRLIHGDAGLHNVLWSAGGLVLLDWELAGWGDPRLDLAWAGWTLRFRGVSPAGWEALLAGYGPEHATALGLDRETLQALALGQAAGLLARAAGQPAWDEWLRRLRWTLDDGRP